MYFRIYICISVPLVTRFCNCDYAMHGTLGSIFSEDTLLNDKHLFLYFRVWVYTMCYTVSFSVFVSVLPSICIVD